MSALLDQRIADDAAKETTAQLATRIWRMFQSGQDTFDIAKSLGIHESRASRLLWAARRCEKGLPAHFMDRHGNAKAIAQ